MGATCPWNVWREAPRYSAQRSTVYSWEGHQANPNWEEFSKIPDQYSSKVSKQQKARGDTLRVGESNWQGISLQHIPTAHAAHYKKKNTHQTTQTKSGWKIQPGIYPKKIYRWLKSTWKNAQYHKLLEKWKVKTTKSDHRTPVRKPITKTSTNDKCWRGCGEKEPLLHCWWERKLVQPWCAVGCAQSRLILWDPMDCSPPGSSVRGIFQARILE